MAKKKPIYQYQAKIIKVYDGDTFTFIVDLGFSITVKDKIRLYGVDTPELRGPQKERGKKVRDYVKTLILDKTVTIKTHKKGKYGRYVCEVFLQNGESLSDHLLQKRMAKKLLY